MKVLLLGSTGSIGVSACNCLRRHPDLFELVGVATNRNGDTLLAQIDEFKPSWAYVASPRAAEKVRRVLPPSVSFLDGEHGLDSLVNETDYDILLNALVGAVGFRPTVSALRRNKKVALANKESLVIGGDVITSLVEEGHGQLVPIDSEHSAILQCLQGEQRENVESIVLTASGGPLRELPADRFRYVTREQALNHPTWSMGEKITIDACTLMNKGFEAIEAHHLFKIPYDRLHVLIHPQSIVHSMVVFHDGAMMAQCGVPDMELPIQFALSYPERLPLGGKRLSLAEVGSLQFFEPDFQRFPCLGLCLDAGRRGGTLPTVLNAANEIAVEAFLGGTLPFEEIPQIVRRALEAHEVREASSVEIVEEVDRTTRRSVREEMARGI